ncbi:thiol-disulfide oxidoreductase DCC family protein [Aurantiacibacter suaedae]|uniref:thiol-disulfide oxidoreductase DCC family protein n=1 Tax=Aurantiacibacter suaedae TaxID=2545755 RepID=UPI0010F59F9D|nr:DUF393 domain-containing protein [Aurantiacibacter suaedae]
MNLVGQVTVWHDGTCPLCQREIALMRRFDTNGAITFIDASAPDAAQTCPLEPALMLERFHAEEEGRLLSGAAAFAAMWRAVPMLRPFGLAARHPLILRGLEALYIRFLRVRPRLQRMLR